MEKNRSNSGKCQFDLFNKQRHQQATLMSTNFGRAVVYWGSSACGAHVQAFWPSAGQGAEGILMSIGCERVPNFLVWCLDMVRYLDLHQSNQEGCAAGRMRTCRFDHKWAAYRIRGAISMDIASSRWLICWPLGWVSRRLFHRFSMI